MSKKVFRTVGMVAGVVAAGLAIATGVGAIAGSTIIAGIASASTITTVAGALSLGTSLLFRPKAPAASSASTDRLSVSIDPRAPRAMVFGESAMPLVIFE